MVLNKAEKALLLSACATELARIKRAINASCHDGIKALLDVEFRALADLEGRLHNEPVEGVKK